MSNTAIDIARSYIARSRGFRWWRGCLWRWAAGTGAVFFCLCRCCLPKTRLAVQGMRTTQQLIPLSSMPGWQAALSRERIISILLQLELLAAR